MGGALVWQVWAGSSQQLGQAADAGTGYDREKCGCAHMNPAEKALGDRSFTWTNQDACSSWPVSGRSTRPPTS